MSEGRRRNRTGRRERGKGVRRTAGATAPRLIAVRVVERVQRAGSFADLALRSALMQTPLPAADRGLATELVYGTLRWRGRLDYLISKVLDRDLAKLEPMVASTLRVGAYQLFFSDRIPAQAAVDEAVRCTRALGAERATGLVNAVLRKLAATGHSIELPDLETDPMGHLVHALSLPEWLAERWLAQYGPEEAAALAAASNAPAPVTLRVNPLRGSREQILEALKERHPGARACAIAPLGIALDHDGDPGRDPAFVRGDVTIQDEASQLVVRLLEPKPGERILDACAAPGTKTTAIAEQLAGEGEVVALDRNGRRLQLVSRAARRLGLGGIAVAERDATKPLDDIVDDRPFDRVLVDAPCSGLGSLRRNPDARWRIKPSDLQSLVPIQRDLLRRAADALRPGGTLVYSTCTLSPEENEQVVRAFLADHPEFRLAPRETLPAELAPVIDDEGFLRCLPHRHDTDGFFAARLEKKAETSDAQQAQENA